MFPGCPEIMPTPLLTQFTSSETEPKDSNRFPAFEIAIGLSVVALGSLSVMTRSQPLIPPPPLYPTVSAIILIVIMLPGAGADVLLGEK